MQRNRQAKIVATLGPASKDRVTIAALFAAGADVFRINFSHGSHAEHRRTVDIVREIEREAGRPIAVLADLQGPKIRVGSLVAPIVLQAGELVDFDLDPAPGTRDRVPLPHPEVFAALAPGASLLLDDGKIRLSVEAAGRTRARCRVEIGGELRERKGVSIVGAILPVSALTAKDRTDLTFALELGVDWVALSFVQRPEDLQELRAVAGRPVWVMTKLEKPSAIDRLDEIIALSDGVMVARGDLGVEMLPQSVPIIQRRVLRSCRKAGKPVVVATQMLESMIAAPSPTRAEASDVATAIYDGADAVMLSAESAAGAFPVEAVKMMDQIIKEVERDPYHRNALDAAQPTAEPSVSDLICDALRRSATLLGAATLVTYTAAGATALRAARERPAATILGLTPDRATARRLAIVWGIHAVEFPQSSTDLPTMIDNAIAAAVNEGLAVSGNIIAVTGGMPFGVSGGTNLLRFVQVT